MNKGNVKSEKTISTDIGLKKPAVEGVGEI